MVLGSRPETVCCNAGSSQRERAATRRSWKPSCRLAGGGTKGTLDRLAARKTLLGYLDVLGVQLNAKESAVQRASDEAGSPGTEERVEYEVGGVRC